MCVLRFLALAFFLPQAVAGQELAIDHPFSAEIARVNFKKCYPETSDETMSALDKIERIEYTTEDIECPLPEGCRPGVEFFRATRRTFVAAGELAPSSVKRHADSAETNGCSFTRVNDFSATVNRKSAHYTFSVRHKKRACDDLLGTHDICDASVDIVIDVRFGEDFRVVTSSDSRNEDLSCGGLSLGGLLVLGSPSIAIFADRAFTTLEFADTSDLFADVSMNGFLGAGLSSERIDDITRAIGLGVEDVQYTKDFGGSGFGKLGEDYVVEVKQDGHLDRLFRPSFTANREREIRFLRSLSEMEPESLVLERGDTLWEIAKERFGDPRLFLMIEDRIGKRGEDLQVGESIQVPRFHEICDQVRDNQLVVKRGESVWSKAQAGQIPWESGSVRTRSGGSVPNPVEIV